MNRMISAAIAVAFCVAPVQAQQEHARYDFPFTVNGQEGTCTYTGGYAQEGKLGRVNSGTFSCAIAGSNNPPVGTFTLTQIDANQNGLNARFNGSDQFCNYDGYFGGLRDVL